MAIEYRWAEGQIDRLPELAADLVRRRVAVIAATGGGSSALAAKAATTTIPIVFSVGEDPVKLGLVASLARPGGNLTGINFFSAELAAKRLELLRELVPGQLASPCSSIRQCQRVPRYTRETWRRLPAPWGCKSRSSTPAPAGEIDAAFATLARERPDALFVGPDPFFTAGASNWPTWRRATRSRDIFRRERRCRSGGLMSYGASIADAYRQVGVYTGRILKGAKPADLPVVQSDQVRAGHQRSDRQDARPQRAADAARPRRRGDRMSNCHLVAARSLIDLVASRLALRAPALRAATALTRPNRSAQRLPCGRHAVPTAVTVGPNDVSREPLR